MGITLSVGTQSCPWSAPFHFCEYCSFASDHRHHAVHTVCVAVVVYHEKGDHAAPPTTRLYLPKTCMNVYTCFFSCVRLLGVVSSLATLFVCWAKPTGDVKSRPFEMPNCLVACMGMSIVVRGC